MNDFMKGAAAQWLIRVACVGDSTMTPWREILTVAVGWKMTADVDTFLVCLMRTDEGSRRN